MPFPTDLEIAQAARMKPIAEVAAGLGVDSALIEPYGHYKAKLPLSLIDEGRMKRAKLVLVTALSPTPAGEGKTTTSIGLHEGLCRLGRKSVVVLREPSLGPVFGMKGGAAGGGYAQVVPMEDINLHFTGDFAAIEKANNLLAALIDNNVQSRTRGLGLDPRTISWKRVMDMNDRALRSIVIGLGGTGNGVPRQDGFNITPASEVMAILCLATSFEDLKKRLGDIYIGQTWAREPKYARDLKAEGAMAILLKDAIKPNLVQTLEGNPAILHGGPFANIAQGVNSVLATRMGLSLGEYVVTEAGFGADLGAEKFFDIKCRAAGLKPDAAVVVATIRALRYHGGADIKMVNEAAPDKVEKGLANLGRHIENMNKFGVKAVVAINQFPTDTDVEIELVKKYCAERGVDAVLAQGFAQGGAGMTALAEAVVRTAESGESKFKPLYDLSLSIQDKIAIIAREVYRADGVDYTGEALVALKRIAKLGLEGVPICMAKTQYSFSDDKALRAAPTGFRITVRDIEIAAGAGFVVPICGEIMRMPGLPETPAAEGMDIDAQGVITGLS
ncbi:MAG: formate--tetrahydrofolate ligase [Flavobacteriales bacterium]|nr:formate--tetrahydrofolate ligase [Flavobacteriales bacterium]